MPVQRFSAAIDRSSKKLSLQLSNSTSRIHLWLPPIFFLCALLGILHHEFWRDELQAWLIARDSSTLTELHNNLAYERHPILWYLCLFGITRFTHDPFAMQIFHLLLATGSVFLVCRFAPFPAWQKLLYSFGYYSFFEYCLISRSYALGVLLLFSACAVFSFPKLRFYYFIQAALLCLLTQTSILGAVLALALAGAILIDSFLDKQGQSVSKRRKALSLVIAVAAAAYLALVQIFPPHLDSTEFRRKTSNAAVTRIYTCAHFFVVPLRGYLPLPQPKLDFWQNSCFDRNELAPFLVVLTLVLIGVVCLAFLDTPALFTAFVFGTFSINAVIISYGSLYPRFVGHCFLLLFSCLWIARFCRKVNWKQASIASEIRQAKRLVNKLFPALLAVQFVVGLVCFCADFLHRFSNSHAAAYYIKRKHLEKMPIVVSPDPLGIALASLLDRQVYQLRSRKVGSYDSNGPKPPPLKTDESIIKRLEEYSIGQPLDFLLVLSRRFRDTSSSEILRWSLLRKYSRSIVGGGEIYFLYKVERRAKDSRKNDGVARFQ